MEQKTIEGTWGEVSRSSRELAEHRVRVTILDELEAPGVGNGAHAETDEPTAFDVMTRAGLIGCLKAAPGTPPTWHRIQTTWKGSAASKRVVADA